MTEQADRTAAAAGYVCLHSAEIRALLRELGDPGPLEDVLAAVRGDADLAEVLDRLHEALQAGGDVLGVYGNADRSAGLRPAGVARPAPVELVFLCPHRRCSRYRWPEPGDADPVCEFDGTPMTRERLR